MQSNSFKCLSNSGTQLFPSKENFASKENSSLIRTVFWSKVLKLLINNRNKYHFLGQKWC